MNFNQKLITGLTLICLTFNVFTTPKSNFDLSSSSIQSLTGGAEDPPLKNITRPILEQNVKVSNNSSSSVLNSKTNVSTSQPGNDLRYFPNGNPVGSVSGNNGP